MLLGPGPFMACSSETPKLKGLVVVEISKVSDILLSSVFQNGCRSLASIRHSGDIRRAADGQKPMFSYGRALQFRRLAGSQSSVGATDIPLEVIPVFVTGKP